MQNQEVINSLIKDPLGTLKKLSNKQIVQILAAADEAFFSSDKPLFSDDIYDIVKGYLKKNDPKNVYLKKVGALIEFNKEKLPYYLGSLDKIKDNEKELEKWKKTYKGEYIISEKLDGISCLIYNDNGTIKMYSRGDGYEGQNITHILPYINLNTSQITELQKQTKIGVRGELIISRANWNKMQDVGANARNVVAGAIHSKTINKDIVSKIEFIAYDIMFPRSRISNAMQYIASLKLPVVRHISMTDNELNNERLSQILQDWRKSSNYEIDGIVVYHDMDHKIMTGKNPKYAFAFKTILTHEQAEVIVTDVVWNISKHRYMKPTVIFNEVSLGGVKIKQATGFNASYIDKNKIGAGSHIIIVRSGDVIPHIVSVLSPSSNGKPKMPEGVQWKWNDTNIDIMLAGEEKNKDQDIQVFTHFMQTLAIDGVKEGVLKKLYDAGYDTLNKIIHITSKDLELIDGFQEKSAQKIYGALQSIHNVQCEKLMIASNVFGRGFGEKKLQLILTEYPYIAFDKTKALKLGMEDIKKIKGIADVTANQFVENLPKYYEFYQSLGIQCISTDKPSSNDKGNKILQQYFKDKTVVFSGFRNKEYERIIQENGGRIVTAISNVTNILVAKEPNDITGKVQKAIDLGIHIMSKDELEKLLSIKL